MRNENQKKTLLTCNCLTVTCHFVMCSTDPLRKKEHCFPLKMRLITFISCSEGYLCSAREEGTSLHSSDSLLWSLSCRFLADSTLVPCWCQDGPSATHAIDLSAQNQAECYFKSNLLPILQTPVQMGNCTPCPLYWKHMLNTRGGLNVHAGRGA